MPDDAATRQQHLLEYLLNQVATLVEENEDIRKRLAAVERATPLKRPPATKRRTT
jgi:hypothetical protein